MTETPSLPAESHRPSRWTTPLAWLLISAALAIGFANTFQEMWRRWFPRWHKTQLDLYTRITGGQSYYTHGPLVPLVSLLIAVMLIRHTRIRTRPARTAGFGVLSLSILIHLVGCLARVNFVSGFAFIGVVMGLILVIWGWEALRRLWFPVAFLLFMVPLPEVTIYGFNFRLKMVAASWGVSIASALGVAAERIGNRVLLEGGKDLVVANVCNGLRTLISLLGFGALYAYFCKLRGVWRLGLFAASLVVALLSNTIRIVSLIMVADIWDTETATGWFHEASGVMVFAIALAMMFGLERLILWVREVVGRPAKVTPLFADVRRSREDDTQWREMMAAAGKPRGWVTAAIMAAMAAGALWLNQTIPPFQNEQTAKAAVPAELEINGTRMYSYDFPLDELTKDVLETGDCLNRVYLAPNTRDIGFCIIFSRDNRKGTHPPDVCLAGAGEGIVAKGLVTVESIDGKRKAPCRELIVQTRQGRHYYLYTYKCGGNYTSSFWVQQYTIFVNGLLDRDASGALIRVSTVIDTTVEEARKRATDLLGAALPHMDEKLK